MNWFDGLLAAMKNKKAINRQKLEQMRNLYRRALDESAQKADNTSTVRREYEEAKEELRRGELTDEQFDAAYDEYAPLDLDRNLDVETEGKAFKISESAKVRNFLRKFTGEIDTDGWPIHYTELAHIKSNIKSRDGHIEPDGKSGRVYTSAYCYEFEVTEKYGIKISDVLMHEDLEIRKDETYAEYNRTGKAEYKETDQAAESGRSTEGRRSGGITDSEISGRDGRNDTVAGREQDGYGRGDIGESKSNSAEETETEGHSREYRLSRSAEQQNDVLAQVKEYLAGKISKSELQNYVDGVNGDTSPDKWSQGERRMSEAAQEIVFAAREAGISVDEYLRSNAEMYEADGEYSAAAREALDSERDSRRAYKVNLEFARDVDAWDGKSNKIFDVGTTSNTLKSIGVKDRGIIWHGIKMAEIMKKHPNMTKDVIKQVPNIMEDPILVLKSRKIASRVVIFGEMTDDVGNPVIAILELEPTDKGGKLIDLNVVASAYVKDSNLAHFILNSDLLYIDKNKNRTQSWMNAVGLQLPSVAPALGSVGSITYPDGKVKITGVPAKQYMQYANKNTSREALDSERGSRYRAYKVLSNVKDVNGNLYGKVVELEYGFFNKFKHNGKKFLDYIRNNLAGKKITVYKDDVTSEVIEFAESNERVIKKGSSNNRRVLGELEKIRDPKGKLVVANVEEAVEISKVDHYNDEHLHQWLDENGWDIRKTYVVASDGEIYPVILNIAKSRDGRNILYNVKIKKDEGVAIAIDASPQSSQENIAAASKITTPSQIRSVAEKKSAVKQYKLTDTTSGISSMPRKPYI